MGCDIHTYVEKKVDGTWRAVIGRSKWNQGHDIEGFSYSGRNYSLFSLLADVRGSCEPISQPRDVPDDLSPEIEAAYKRWDADGHSHSYYLLSELLDVDPERFSNARSEDFLKDTIPLLEAIAEGDPASVRFIFWFDN